ncbi:MAG: lysophospholipid acyltransferase family protein [Armatimonadaceae bacterium]
MKEAEQERPRTLTVWFLALVLSAAVRLLYRTLQVTVKNEETLKFLQKEYGGVILVTWHGQSLIPVAHCRGRGYTGLISLSRDGDLLTEFFRRMQWRVIRGSTRRGGVRAAKRVIHTMKNNANGMVLAITPDGPRGPRCKVQPGAVFLAQKSGKPIVAVGISARYSWYAKSWDRFLIPRPFSPVMWHYGEPIFVTEHDDVSAVCLKVEKAINALEAEAQREWSHRTEKTVV